MYNIEQEIKMTTLKQFLNAHKNQHGQKPTHTIIGDKSLNIYGGSYYIPEDELTQFYKLYCESLKQGNTHYLTETQRNDDNAILYVDVDLHFEKGTTERMIQEDHIYDLVDMYCEKINAIIDVDCSFKVYAMMKDNVNVLNDKTKDGLHLVFNLKMNHKLQQYLRDEIIKSANDVLGDLSLKNTYNDVFDDALSKGINNTQLYGSMKPAHEAYKIKYIFDCNIEDGNYNIDCEEYKGHITPELLMSLSSYKTDNALNGEYKNEIVELANEKYGTKKKINKRVALQIEDAENENNTGLSLDTINKWWDYAKLIDKETLESYENWFKFACIHKNCLGEEEYLAFDLFCQTINGYDECGNKIIYDEKIDLNRNIKAGWIALYKWAEESNPEEKLKLDEKHKIVEEVMNIHKLLRIKSNIEMDEDLKTKIEMMEDLNAKRKKEVEKEKTDFIKKVTYDELKKKKNYFEKFHFKVMTPPCYGRLSYNKTSLLSKAELRQIYENVKVNIDEDKRRDFVDMWLECEYIRTFEKVDFLPYPKKCESYIFNTFNGLRCERIRANENVDISILLDHMKILTGHDEKGFTYLLNYLAHIIQKPGELPRVALVFQSNQGVGKNIFFENFGRVFLGDEYLLSTAEMEKVIGRFSMINNKLMTIMDETSGKDSFTNSNKIKSLITAEQIAWERKGIDGVNINNCGRYLFFSNNSTPVKIENTDRRFVVYQCADDVRNNREYFKKIVKLFNDDNVVKSFYKYLKNIDISEWDSINDRPITEAYKDIQSATIPAMAHFLVNRIYEYEAIDDTKDDGFHNKKFMEKTGATGLFNLYKDWLKENGYSKIDITATSFGRDITKYEGVEKKRTNAGQIYMTDFNKLKSYLLKQRYMEELEMVED
jgi:hypothetical protein